jgi:hypothetical protein
MHILEKNQYNFSASGGLKTFNNFWDDLCDKMSQAFNLDSEKESWLKGKEVARLIAAIPFLAGCRKPEQTAAAHVSIYLLSVLESTKSIFQHDEWNDDTDIMNRLSPVANFDGGDQQIIERGMNLLALNMICGYERDIQKDTLLNKYNPVARGAWDYSTLKAKLISRIISNPCSEMDEIFNMDAGIFTFWGH